MENSREARSFVNEATWPEKLAAHVVTPTEPRRIHGFLIEEDLARHYNFGAVIYLSLKGELPSEAQEQAFEFALICLAPALASEAATHAAILAQVSGAYPPAVLGTGLIALAFSAQAEVQKHEPFLAAILKDEAPSTKFFASTTEERVSVDHLRERMRQAGLEVPSLSHDLGRLAALFAVLVACGFQGVEQLETILVIAQTACMSAEAFSWKLGRLRAYPVNLPRFVYEGADANR